MCVFNILSILFLSGIYSKTLFTKYTSCEHFVFMICVLEEQGAMGHEINTNLHDCLGDNFFVSNDQFMHF